jgi:hypothetical protein
VFKEPIFQILIKIKGEPFFVWQPKLPSDLAARDQKLQCSYHRDKGHLTENYHKFKTYLEKLVSDGHLGEYIDSNLTEPKGRGLVSNRSGNLGAAPIGVIHVILKPLCTSILSVSFRSDLQKTAHLRQSFGLSDSAHLAPKSCSEVPKSSNQQVISFSNGDLRDVQLPHSDPLVITLEIGNYDVKKVLIDQGSFAEVMYQELYEKLGWESLISPISHPQCSASRANQQPRWEKLHFPY